MNSFQPSASVAPGPIRRLFNLFSLSIIFLSASAKAVCPVCTVAVAAGVGILRGWGVDDVLTGLWYGALVLSSVIWLLDELKKRNINFPYRTLISIIFIYGLMVVPLAYPLGIIGAPHNTIFGYDRMLFGMVIGTILFIMGIVIDKRLRCMNDCKQLIIYQKVVVPVVLLIISTIIAYLALQLVA